MGNIENLYKSFSVVNSINYPVISDTQAIIKSIAQFFTAKRPGIDFQRNELWGNTILERGVEFPKLVFGAGDDFDSIIHQEFFSLRSPVKKIFNGREDWQLRVSAMVRSIMSSLKRALCIRPNNTAFCSALGNAPNAVRKTSALACTAVIGEPPLQDKFTTVPTMCQGENAVFYRSPEYALKQAVVKTTQKILDLVRQNPPITREELAKAIGLSNAGIKFNLNKMKKENLLRRIGPDKGGHWEITKI